jgi:hypothetical protein
MHTTFAVTPARARHAPVRATARRGRYSGVSRGGLDPRSCRQARHVVHSASPALSGDDDASAAEPAEPSSAPDKAPEKKGILQSIKKFFIGDKLDKERLAALGMGAFASYGTISNLTYGICMTTAWISFVRATGLSPLAPGQWKGFLVYYATLFTIQNIIRPLRFSLAIALAPLFDRAIDGIGKRLGITKKWAFGVMIFLIGAGTTVSLGSALYLLGGFPPIAPSA